MRVFESRALPHTLLIVTSVAVAVLMLLGMLPTARAEYANGGGGGGGGGGGCDPSVVSLQVTSVSVYKTGAVTEFSWGSSPAGTGATFYWGPESDPDEYANSVSGTSSFSVTLPNVASGIVPGDTYLFYIYVDPPASTCSTEYLGGTYSSDWQALWFNAIVSNYAWNLEAWEVGAGTYAVSSGPTATAAGGVQVNEGTGAIDPLGAAQVESKMQFYGQVAAFPSSTEVAVTMTYALQWAADAISGPCPYGCGSATTQITIEGNVYFVTSAGATGWVYDGDQATSVANQYDSTASPTVQSDTAYYTVSFDTCFAGGTYYQLYTYLLTNSESQASAIDASQSALAVSGSVSLAVQPTTTC